MARQAALANFRSGPAAVDWDRMAARARSMRRAQAVALYAFLVAVSLPIILPYFWLVTIAFSARTGVAEAMVLFVRCSCWSPP
jgi:inositol-phosphate transport system permease protein